MTDGEPNDVSQQDATVSPQTVEVTGNFADATIYTAPGRLPRRRWWQRRNRQVQSTEDLEKAALASRNVLRKGYGWSLLAILAAQIIFADWIFYEYAKVGRSWDVEAPVMDMWLGATVVEVISITTIVVRHLFPRQDKP